MAARRPKGRHRHAGPRHDEERRRADHLPHRGAADAAGGAEGRRRGAGEDARADHAPGVPSLREADWELLQGLAECVRGRRLSGQTPARLPADRRPELRPGRHSRAGGYGDERTQNPLGVRSVRHRQSDRPSDGGGHARFRGRDNRRDKSTGAKVKRFARPRK